MFKKIVLAFLLSTLGSTSFAMSGQPDFILLPNTISNYWMSNNAEQAVAIQNQAIETVKKTLNITSASPYKAVRIRIIYNDKNSPQALIVYLLSSKFKSMDMVRINLADNFVVTSVERNYELQTSDLSQSPHYTSKSEPKCPDETVQFVIGNNFTHDASVEKEVQKVYQMAKDHGYNPFLMDTNDPKAAQPTVQAYENWLSCPNLKGFYNESHGATWGIVLSDDDFTYKHVNKNLINKLNHEVILFDSCVTFHDPLLSTMINADKGNAQQYVAGIINLPFGASERTASCFWEQAFNHQDLHTDMLAECSRKHGLTEKGFGIGGSGDNHLTPAQVQPA